MPIEIKELHIKINVDDSQQTNAQRQKPAANREAIVAACVEEVMQLEKRKNER